MPFNVRASHINPDFTFDPIPAKRWVQLIEDPHELALFLNRMAIATSQDVAEDPPIAEITYHGRRVTVEASAGFLYYSDPTSPNRRNLKVLAEEVAPLIYGEELDVVFGHRHSQYEMPDGMMARHRVGAGNGQAFRRFFWAVFFVVIGICGYAIVNTLSDPPMLMQPANFIPHNFGYDGLLPKLKGVYVSEFRDGGFVCEIKNSGDFVLYEMWRHQSKDGFVLMQVETLKLQEGLNDDIPVLLAGKFRLIRPLRNGDISMQGIVMEKQRLGIEEMGEVIVR